MTTDLELKRSLQDLLDTVSPVERRAIRSDLARTTGGAGSNAWRDQLVANATQLRAKHGLLFGNEVANVETEPAQPLKRAEPAATGSRAWRDQLVANAGHLRAKHGILLEGERVNSAAPFVE